MYKFVKGDKGVYIYRTKKPYKILFTVHSVNDHADIVTVKLVNGSKVNFDREYLNKHAIPLDKIEKVELLEMIALLTINLAKAEETVTKLVLQVSNVTEIVRDMDITRTMSVIRSITEKDKKKGDRSLIARLLGIG